MIEPNCGVTRQITASRQPLLPLVTILGDAPEAYHGEGWKSWEALEGPAEI